MLAMLRIREILARIRIRTLLKRLQKELVSKNVILQILQNGKINTGIFENRLSYS
jgi:hypothetical protein